LKILTYCIFSLFILLGLAGIIFSIIGYLKFDYITHTGYIGLFMVSLFILEFSSIIIIGQNHIEKAKKSIIILPITLILCTVLYIMETIISL